MVFTPAFMTSDEILKHIDKYLFTNIFRIYLWLKSEMPAWKKKLFSKISILNSKIALHQMLLQILRSKRKYHNRNIALETFKQHYLVLSLQSESLLWKHVSLARAKKYIKLIFIKLIFMKLTDDGDVEHLTS